MPLSPALPIGVFDSGVGGLTVVKELQRALPQEDILYLGDTARVPYGIKSPGTVARFACEDIEFLLARGVKAVVVACNTCSAWALPLLRRRYRVPVFGVIQPGVAAALARSRSRRIGVIGTGATIRSQEYGRGLLAGDARVKVFSAATPLLVPLVEEGWLNHPITRAVLRQYLRPLVRAKVDALILGCTHYPLLKKALRAIAGPRVHLIDSGESCARYVREQLAALGLAARRPRPGMVQAFVTDEAERFSQQARRFLGQTISAHRIELAPAAAVEERPLPRQHARLNRVALQPNR